MPERKSLRDRLRPYLLGAASIFDLSGSLTYREARRALPPADDMKTVGEYFAETGRLIREAMDDAGIPKGWEAVTVFYCSDTHFAHAFVSGLRAFDSPEEHDEQVIANWNAAVKPGDLVWHLGDVGLGNEAAILARAARLNGVKHLVAGNHDRCWPGHRDARKRQRAWLEVFESVQAFAKTRIDGRTVLLSHLPYEGAGDHTAEERYPQFRLPDLGEWLVHGHTHSSLRVDGPRSVHVGLDAWGLKPVSEGAIAALIRETEEGMAA